MKLNRTLACLFLVAALPLLASTSHIAPANSAPFASVALAGHVIGGSATCACGCPSCICDPEEPSVECNQSNQAASNQTDKGVNRDGSPIGAAPTSDLDFGSSALILALAFFVWARFLRA